MKNFYKLNKEYIKTFMLRVLDRYRENDKRSEVSFFKSLLEEVHELFRKFGGRTVSKRSIPAPNDFPDSIRYNKLLKDIGFDIDKLFNAQKLIESDINNLLNFNSSQRTQTFENLTSAQQEVYSAYVKSKRDVIGGVEVPEGNPFTSADNLSPESIDVCIDETRKVLTLGFTSEDNRDIDIKNTLVRFAGRIPDGPRYPLGDTMGTGSHWKKLSIDPHFINTDNTSSIEYYKTMMIDTPSNNIGVGYCEFEAVRTNADGNVQVSTDKVRLCGKSIVSTKSSRIEKSIVHTLKEYIGKRYNKDEELIYLDIANSLQGDYVVQYFQRPTYSSEAVPKYKLVIPLTSQILTNEVVVEFSANDAGFIPKINWVESKIFSNIGGGDTAYALIVPQADDITDGKYICHVVNYVYPTRLELMLEYPSDSLMWTPIDFYMAHYVYSAEKSYEMPYYNTNAKLNVVIRKTYDIFVDSEKNDVKERARALNVLRTPNRSS